MLPIYFVGLYILSSIVRYKPALWLDIIGGIKTGSITMVESFLFNAFRRFPNDVLQLIWNEDFTYGSPAYYTP
jgi:hypothetical protein